MRAFFYTVTLLGLTAAQSQTSQSSGSGGGGDGGFGALTSQIGQLTVNSGVPSGVKPSSVSDTLPPTGSTVSNSATVKVPGTGTETGTGTGTAEATGKATSSSSAFAAPTLQVGAGLLGAGLAIVAML